MKDVYSPLNANPRRKFIKDASFATVSLYFLPKVVNGMPLTTERANNFTRYGCLFQDVTAEDANRMMWDAGFNLTRVPIFLSKTSASVDKVMKHVQQHMNVQINLDWKAGTYPVPFPTDLRELIKRILQVLEGFDNSPYRDQVPFMCIENEWDNLKYHRSTVDYYIRELEAVTFLCHRHGVKVGDAGLTSTSLRRWMYSQLSGREAEVWKRIYYVGEKKDNYQALLDRVELYISLIGDVPIDYLNVHWYNIEGCFNGFAKAAGTYLARCGKSEIITNEFGIRRQSFDMWEKTVKEVASYQTAEGMKPTRYAIAYSGIDEPEKAVRLTPDMLKLLADPPIQPVAVQQPKIIKADNLAFPNPARDYFVINTSLFKNTEVKILSVANSSGKTILQQKLTGSGMQRIDLPGHIQKGVYIVCVATGIEIYQQNLVVE
jgi:hypothetical protein